MAQKYEILHEIDWDETTQSPVYERLSVVKNEQAAVDFVNNVDNIGKYGNMVIKLKSNGNTSIYNEKKGVWENV